MSQELDILESNNKRLNRENAELREKLWDKYFTSALPPLLLSGLSDDAAVQRAALVAENMMQVRKGRWS